MDCRTSGDEHYEGSTQSNLKFSGIEDRSNLRYSNESIEGRSNLRYSNEGIEDRSNLRYSNESIEGRSNLRYSNESIEGRSNLRYSNESIEGRSNLRYSNESIEGRCTRAVIQHTRAEGELDCTTVFPQQERGFDHGHSALVVAGSVVVQLRNSEPHSSVWVMDSHESNEQVSSSGLATKVDLDVSSARKILVGVYSARPEVPEGSWPPKGNRDFIKFELVDSGRSDGVNNVITKKDSICPEELFADPQSGTLLLIEGRPGVGKTTFVHKISRDWALNDRSYGSVKLLFLCHLRRFFNNAHVQLRDIIQEYIESDKYVDQIVQLAEENEGEGLCFILDGLDEYTPELKSATFVFKLIQKKILPRSVVIVASRPTAIAELKKTATKHVEVLGFTKDQVLRYISSYPFTDGRNSEILKHYLIQSPALLHMCYLPIHTAMVCFVFDATGKIPHTCTEMYADTTRVILILYLRRNQYGENFDLESAAYLPSKERDIFLQICELGFIKSASPELVARRKLSRFLASSSETFGLVSVESLGSRQGFYNFLHLTFQEYLAAYHISQLTDEEQQRIIHSCGKNGQMHLVWKFYCGLARMSARKFEDVLLWGDSLFSVQCSFESQQPITCDCIIRSGESGTLTFQGNILTPADFTAIEYVIRNTTFAVKTLEFESCRLGSSTVEPISALLSSCTDLQALSFTRCDDFFSNGGAVAISAGFKGCINLQEVALYNNNIGVENMKVLARSLMHLPNLKTLNLQRNNIGIDGIVTLSETLKHCRSIEILDLQENNIDAHGAAALAIGLKHCTNLQRLSLGLNTFGIPGTRILSYSLKLCHNLRAVDLHGINMCADGVKALGQSLNRCAHLEVLELSYNELCADGIKELSTSLDHTYYLQTLGLQKNNIGDDGAKALTRGLRHWPDLQTLNLEGNNIGDDGLKAISENLKHLPDLVTLDLRDNNIGDVSAKALASNIRRCRDLVTLDLQGNKIGDDGAKALADGLKECPDFSVLLIRNNEISNGGIQALTYALRQFKSDCSVDG